MNKKFKELLKAYKNDEYLEKISNVGKDRYTFIDEFDGYTYTINNVDNICIAQYFNFIKDIEMLKSQSKFLKIVNLHYLEKILNKCINPEMFIGLDSIIVLMSKDDEIKYQNFLGRDILDSCVGQTNLDSNSIVINMHRIMESVLKMEKNEVDFFETCVYQFYLTLLHELGHSSFRVYEFDEDFAFNVGPLQSDLCMDEEYVVENFARETFIKMDSKYKIFEVFEKEYFFNFFNKN